MPVVDTYRERAGTLAAGILKEHARNVDQTGRFPKESVAALGPELLGMCVPAEYGGGGQGLRAFAAVAEELAQGCSSTAMVFVMHVSAVQAIAASPTLARKAELLREIAGGRAPDDARALGEGIALAVLGAGLADGAGERPDVRVGREVVGHLGGQRRLVRRQRAEAGRGIAARVDAVPGPACRPGRAGAARVRRPRPARQRLGAGVAAGRRRHGRRPDHPAGRGRRGDAAGDPAVVQHRHGGDGERPVPRRRRRHRRAPAGGRLRAHRDGAARPADAARAAGGHERPHRAGGRAARPDHRSHRAGRGRGAAVRAADAAGRRSRRRSTSPTWR